VLFLLTKIMKDHLKILNFFLFLYIFIKNTLISSMI